MNLNNKNAKTYNKNGVIVLKKVFSNKEIFFLKRKINTYIKNYKSKLRGKEINLINNKINSIHKFKDLFFKKFSNQNKIKEIGNFFLKEESKIRHFEYFAKPAKIGLASPMHQDNYYWNLVNPNAFTIWIAIDNANKKNGSVDYLIGSHLKLHKHIASYAPGSSQKIKNISTLKKYKSKSFNLEIGDCLMHHSQIIHGSKKNLSNNSRRGFTIQMMPKSAKVNSMKLKKYQVSLSSQIKIRKKLD
jgi:phytanoyl-CoA hydroxylase